MKLSITDDYLPHGFLIEAIKNLWYKKSYFLNGKLPQKFIPKFNAIFKYWLLVQFLEQSYKRCLTRFDIRIITVQKIYKGRLRFYSKIHNI